jgi:Arc/MetJ-type ribon-helix-helix transcriptional regulator
MDGQWGECMRRCTVFMTGTTASAIAWKPTPAAFFDAAYNAQEQWAEAEQLTRGAAIPTLKAMDVQLTSDQKAFARRAIESGRLQSEEDAVKEALALWEERERHRAEFLLTLDEARASLARGEGRIITEDAMRQLAHDVKERGRGRLLAELTTPR